MVVVYGTSSGLGVGVRSLFAVVDILLPFVFDFVVVVRVV